MTTKGPKTPQVKKNQPAGLFLSAFGMGVGTLSSRILGFLRDMVLVGVFPKIVSDCFVLGFRVPNFFRRVLGEGALSVGFIPKYLELKVEHPEKAKKLKDVTFSFLTALSGVLSFFGVLYMEQLVSFLISLSAAGGSSVFMEPEPYALSVSMGRWMFVYLFLVTEFAYFMSVLNAHKRFWVAGFAPTLFNLGFLCLALLPTRYVLFEGHQLALGVLLGGLLQAALVGGYCFKELGFPKIDLQFCFRPFQEVLSKTLPGILGIGVLQFISIINISLCAYVGKGALTYLYLADRILELPQSLIAVSIGTAMLPSLSEMWVKNRKDFDETFLKSIRLYLFFALPSALGLYFLALPISQLLFQRGETGFADVLEVSKLVQVYALLLIVSGLSKITLPVYYSFKNTWYPASLSLVVVVGHYFMGQALVKSFGLEGVVLTTLFSGALNLCLLFLGLKIFIKRSYILSLVSNNINLIWPVSALALFLMSTRSFVPLEKTLSFYVLSVGLMGASVLLYFAMAFLFKMEESAILQRLFEKFKSRKR